MSLLSVFHRPNKLPPGYVSILVRIGVHRKLRKDPCTPTRKRKR